MKAGSQAEKSRELQNDRIYMAVIPCTDARDSSIRRLLAYKQRLENIRGM